MSKVLNLAYFDAEKTDGKNFHSGMAASKKCLFIIKNHLRGGNITAACVCGTGTYRYGTVIVVVLITPGCGRDGVPRENMDLRKLRCTYQVWRLRVR